MNWFCSLALATSMLPLCGIGGKCSHLANSRRFAVLQLLSSLASFLFDRREATLVGFLDMDSAFLGSHSFIFCCGCFG